MRKILLVFFLAFMGLAGFQARADAATVEMDASGFVDFSYSGNDTADVPAGIEADRNTFAIDEVELDIAGKPGEKTSFRVDLQFVNSDVALTTDDIVEQAYMDIHLDPFTLTAGKFNAPIGFELLDKPDMYQATHAMVFNFGIPTNLTGVMASGSFGIIDVSLYVVNGWDLLEDNNKDKTFGTRVGFNIIDGINLGLSFIGGKEKDVEGLLRGLSGDDQKTLAVFDADFTLDLLEHLVVGAELNFGSYEGQSVTNPGTDAEWSAYLVTAHYEFTNWFGLTLRLDGFDDQDGARLGSKKAETRTAFTVAPQFEIAEALEITVEYKITSSDEDVFKESGGTLTDNQNSGVLELVYKF